jgi:hypothetical protein
MDLTDSFTWEDLPTKDADTGQWTAAGWLPRINTFSTRIAIALTLFHLIQSSIRIVSNHETMFIVWYPFDWTVSPYYELVNVSQVTKSQIPLRKYCYVYLVLKILYYQYVMFFSYFSPLSQFSENRAVKIWNV